MIVCKTCGEQNENDARFCANCSSYLEWDGQAVPTGPVPVHMLDRNQQAPAPGQTAPPTTPGAPPPPAGNTGGGNTPYTPPPTTVINVPREMLNRPASGLAGDPGAMPPAPPPAPPTGPPPGPPRGAPPGPPPGYQQQPPPGGYNPYPAGGYPAPNRPPGQPGPGQSGPGQPGAGPQPRMPGAQQPSEPVRRRRRQPDISNQSPGVAPGEIACRVCGTGNTPDRKFCRTCGTAMLQEQAPPPERVGFWRRLFGSGGRSSVAEAGTRHRNVRQPIHWIRPLVILGVIAALLIVGFGPGRPYIVKGVDLARDRFATKVPATPNGWAQSSFTNGTRGQFLSDGKLETFWAPAPNKTTKGVGDSVTFTFSPAIGRLTNVAIINGINANAADFRANRRPSELEFDIFSADGTDDKQSVALEDVAGSKTYTITGTNVNKIVVTIKAIAPGDDNKPVCINEMMFSQDKSRVQISGK